MTKERFLGTLWRELVTDPEAICALSLGNLAALVLLLLLQTWACFGGR